MSTPYFAGDFHLGDTGILRYRPKIIINGKEIVFTDNDHHDQVIIDVVNSKLTKRDVLYAMGDICISPDKLHLLKKLKCLKRYLILGNHDNCHIKEYAEYFDDIYGLHRYKNMWLSHCPIHPDELYGRPSVHGHLHSYNIDDKRYFNTCLDRNGHLPVSLNEIKAKLNH